MTLATLAILVLLVLASVLFSSSEAALFSLTPVQVRQIEARRDRSSKSVLKLLKTPQKLLSALLAWSTLVNVGLSALVTSIALAWRGEAGLKVAILLSTVGILVVCEILPKTVAVNFPRSVGRINATILAGVIPLISPLTWGVGGISRLLLRAMRLPGIEDRSGRRVTATELREAFEDVDSGMSKIENRLVQNILSFSSTSVEEVMTPRVDIVAAPVTANAQDLLEIITRSKHSRIPLYENTLDRIVGFLASRDFLLEPARRIPLFTRSVLIVPEKAPADRVFHDLRKGRWQMAVVVNEYGETVGIVTAEDLIEEVVGELYDEFERTEEEVVPAGPDLFEARGNATLHDLGEKIGVELPQEQAVTLNGFLCALYGGFPRVGTVIRWEDFEFEVLEAGRHRITRVRIRRCEPREAIE